MEGNEELQKIIGNNIYIRRTGKKWTQKDLAAHLGQNQPYVAHLEKGNAMPTDKTLAKLAEVFKCKPKDFLVRMADIDYAKELTSLLPSLEYHQLRILFLVADEMTRERKAPTKK